MELSQTELLIYIGIVVLVLFSGVFMYRKEISFFFRKQEVEGTIVNWMSSVVKGKRYFYPMIEYRLPDVEKISFRADERCENAPLYAPGTKVIIRYLPSDIEFRKVIYPKA